MLASEKSSLQSIAEHFEEHPDPRSEVNREHLLVDVIVISICAILAGADGPTAIAMWAKSPSVAACRTRDRHVGENLAWLRRFALGLLKQHPNTKTSLAMKCRQAGWCVSFLSEVLDNPTTW